MFVVISVPSVRLVGMHTSTEKVYILTAHRQVVSSHREEELCSVEIILVFIRPPTTSFVVRLRLMQQPTSGLVVTSD
jgi:hypothetical protein